MLVGLVLSVVQERAGLRQSRTVTCFVVVDIGIFVL